jgi:hypothetical protein
MHNPVGKSSSSHRPAASIGYVLLPPDVDRAAYVASCYQTGTVSVVTTDGEALHRVPVTREAMAHLAFPEDPKVPGTMVALLGIPPTNRPVVTGTFQAPDVPAPAAAEHGWGQLLTRAGRSAAFHANAEQARLQLTASGDATQPAVLALRATGPDSRLEAEATDVVTTAERTVTLDAGEALAVRLGPHGDDAQPTTLTLRYDDAGLRVADRHGNELEMTKDHLRLRSAGGRVLDLTDTLSMGSETASAEPAVLGDQLTGWLGDLSDALARLTVTTGTGPSGVPINVAEFSALKARLDQILSRKTTLD